MLKCSDFKLRWSAQRKHRPFRQPLLLQEHSMLGVRKACWVVACEQGRRVERVSYTLVCVWQSSAGRNAAHWRRQKEAWSPASAPASRWHVLKRDLLHMVWRLSSAIWSAYNNVGCKRSVGERKSLRIIGRATTLAERTTRVHSPTERVTTRS